MTQKTTTIDARDTDGCFKLKEAECLFCGPDCGRIIHPRNFDSDSERVELSDRDLEREKCFCCGGALIPTPPAGMDGTVAAYRMIDRGEGPPYSRLHRPMMRATFLFQTVSRQHGKQFYLTIDGTSRTWLSDDEAVAWVTP